MKMQVTMIASISTKKYAFSSFSAVNVGSNFERGAPKICITGTIKRGITERAVLGFPLRINTTIIIAINAVMVIHSTIIIFSAPLFVLVYVIKSILIYASSSNIFSASAAFSEITSITVSPFAFITALSILGISFAL